MTLVSVIIPTYNRSEYLQEAISSVLNQTYRDFEIIIVDDGSSDNTAKVVRKIHDPRLRYLFQANAGRSHARNRGMDIAQGKYIAFLDDDDLFLPDKLINQVTFLEAHPGVDLVASGAEIIDKDSNQLSILRPWETQPYLTMLNCLYACPILPSSVLFRRRVINHLDHWFDPTLNLSEDKDFFIRLFYAGCNMSWLPKILSVYRIHPTNSQRDGANYSQDRLKFLNKFFSLSSLPPEIQEERKNLFTHYHLLGACHAYATGQVTEAQEDLGQAFRIDPKLANGEFPEFITQVVSFADTYHVENPKEYIDFVFEHLPEALSLIDRSRMRAHSAYHFKQVFEASSMGGKPSFRDWLYGIWYDPNWLRNRGVWSILVRNILMKTK